MADGDAPPFRFRTPIHVRWSDCDPFGHVNNAVYLTYLEQARFAYWHEVLPDVPFPGLILARIEIDYRAQAFPDEHLELFTGIVAMGTTSFTVDYEIRKMDGTVVARARSVQVFFDYATSRPVPIASDFRERVHAYEGTSDLTSAPGTARRPPPPDRG